MNCQLVIEQGLNMKCTSYYLFRIRIVKSKYYKEGNEMVFSEINRCDITKGG